MNKNIQTARLSVLGLSIAYGLVWALSLFALSMITGYMDLDDDLVDIIATYYDGYGLGLQGALVGALYGFVDGAIGGALIALIYNGVTKGLCCICCCKKNKK